MAGKSWQPSHEPPNREGEQAPLTMNKQWKEGGNGWGRTAWMKSCHSSQVHAQSTCSKYMQEHLQGRAHGIPAQSHICKKPLTNKNANALCCQLH